MAERTTLFKGKPLPLVGSPVKVGDKAPDFNCVNSGLETVNLAKTSGKVRLLSAVPSLDTPVCSAQTKKFDEALGALKDKVTCYTISLDMPFAQKRFCTTENISNVQTLSDMANESFGKNYGVLITGLPSPRLSRALFVLDKHDKVTYVEYVPEVGQHPNYDNALNALKAVAG